MRRFLLFLCAAVALLALLCLSAAASPVSVEYTLDGASVGEDVVEEGEPLTLPAAPDMGARVFLGWALTDAAGARTLYPAAHRFEILPQGESLSFAAFGVDLRTLTGAAASLAENTLRFDGALDKADAARLQNLGVAFSCGVLTAPAEEIAGGSKVFEKGVAAVTDFPADGFAAESEEQGVFFGYVRQIAASDLTRRYAGRAYLTVQFSSGETGTFYAPFALVLHARSLHAVSAMAVEDRRQTADSVYCHATATSLGTYYSPYDAAALAFLTDRLDRVVSVDDVYTGDVLTGGVVTDTFTPNAIQIYTFRFYQSPYRVSGFSVAGGIATFCITGLDGADFHRISCYYVGGSYRRPSGSECGTDGYYITERTTVTG